ncbi:hypothetical protein [Canibacter zhoujuaniae]|uniref:hypothetical protein n=1 Tax=Canibacter zhoujuaniae TaxID=2708343 RepID=UPI00141D9608|nr:hypothetical protein [Canibacter zhoujuaniae]
MTRGKQPHTPRYEQEETPRDAAPAPYQLDYDWVWDGAEVKTLAVTVVGASLDDFLESLEPDINGVRGSGGWAIFPQAQPGLYHLVAGGEDVADALEDAADRLYQAVKQQPGARLFWEQL